MLIKSCYFCRIASIEQLQLEPTHGQTDRHTHSQLYRILRAAMPSRHNKLTSFAYSSKTITMHLKPWLYFAYLTESASVVTLMSGWKIKRSNSSTSCISPEEVLYIVTANIVKGIFEPLGTSSVSTNTTVSLTEAMLSNGLKIFPKNGSVVL